VAAFFCHRCGAANSLGARFCTRYGTALVANIPSSPIYQPIVVSTPSSHTGRNVGVVIAILFLILVVALIVPVPHNFSENFSTGLLSVGGASLTVPDGSSVQGSWSTNNGGSVTFQISDANGHVVYTADAASGSFGFSATNPPYVFAASAFFSESVSVTGTYTAPLL
jgi:hypothetical protein